jgi:hypothetical protein
MMSLDLIRLGTIGIIIVPRRFGLYRKGKKWRPDLARTLRSRSLFYRTMWCNRVRRVKVCACGVLNHGRLIVPIRCGACGALTDFESNGCLCRKCHLEAWAPMSLATQFVHKPDSWTIADDLNARLCGVCTHGRRPCYVFCGVMNERGTWRPIHPYEHARWFGSFYGLLFKQYEQRRGEGL